VVKEIDYDSFGNIINDTLPSFTTPFGFAGGLSDRDTKLVHFGFRDYDPDAGRWTAKDPILFAGGNTDLYGYCLSDPVNWVDPTGQLLPTAIIGGFAGAFSGVVTGLQSGNVLSAVVGGLVGGVVGAAVGSILPQWSGIAGAMASGSISGAWGGAAGGVSSAVATPCLTAYSVLEGARSGVLTGALMGALNAPFAHLARLGVGTPLVNTAVGETAVAMASRVIATPVGIIYSMAGNSR
jgi:RHS repeat-associated protein